MGYRVFVDLFPPKTVEVITQGQTVQQRLEDPLPCEVKQYDSARGILTVRFPGGKEWTILSVPSEPLPDATLMVQRLQNGKYELVESPPGS
jgi:hypothetical protein